MRRLCGAVVLGERGLAGLFISSETRLGTAVLVRSKHRSSLLVVALALESASSHDPAVQCRFRLQAKQQSSHFTSYFSSCVYQITPMAQHLTSIRIACPQASECTTNPAVARWAADCGEQKAARRACSPASHAVLLKRSQNLDLPLLFFA